MTTFSLTPEHPGIWNFPAYPGEEYYRKWDGKQWCLGTTAISAAMGKTLQVASHYIQAELDEEGIIPVFVCYLDGSKPAPPQQQLELF